MRNRFKHEKGLSLVGLIVSLAIGVMVVAGAVQVFISTQRAQSRLTDATNLAQDIRLVSQQMLRELRMAGYGVDAGQAIAEAGTFRMAFHGDVEDDLRLTLASNAYPGDTQIEVDLNDEEPSLAEDDLVFLDGTKRETVPVRGEGSWYDVGPEPDIVYLAQPLAYAHDAATTTVHTVETTVYEYLPQYGTLLRNGSILTGEVETVAFRYYDSYGNELTPADGGSLSDYEISQVRQFTADLILTNGARGDHDRMEREFSVTVDLRNQGFLHYRNDHCPPEAPSSIQVQNTGTCRHLLARWTPPSTNACDGSNLEDLHSYRIYYGSAPGQYFKPAYTVNDPDAYQAWVSDVRLENDSTYYVAVSAMDESFNESGLSPETSFTLIDEDGPAPPETITAEAGAGTVTLRWSASPSRDALGYRVHRSTDPGFTPSDATVIVNEEELGANAREYADGGLDPCTTYYYAVAAVDCVQAGEASDTVFGDGEGGIADEPEDGEVNTTPTEETPTPPAAVNPFTASAGTGQVELNWAAPEDSDLERIVVRFGNSSYPSGPEAGEGIVDLDAQPSATGSFTHADLINGYTYYYSAFAIDRCGNVSDAAHAEATPQAGVPHVRLIAPYPGETITDGQLHVEAQAYDPAAAGLSDPPDFYSDNGKGISRVTFHSSPRDLPDMPRTERIVSYCGFGGDASPCPKGDVGDECPGTYYVYAEAQSASGDVGTSPLVHFFLDSGGLDLDTSYEVQASTGQWATVQYQLEVTAQNMDVEYRKLRLTWDDADARLIGWGNQWYQFLIDRRWDQDLPYESGVELDLPNGVEFWSGETSREILTFVYAHTKLKEDLYNKSTSCRVISTDGFAVGDTIYFRNHHNKSAVIAAINGDTITFTEKFRSNVWKDSTVSKYPDIAAVDMSGAKITAEYDYRKGSNDHDCTLSLELDVAAGLHLDRVYQDRPQADTVALKTAGQVPVQNNTPVPVHVAVRDWSGSGIEWVRLYSAQDDAGLGEAPASGYGYVTMSFDAGDDRYEATLSGGEDTRVWYYVVVRDAEGEDHRSPADGAYTFDFDAYALPDCPSGLTLSRRNNSMVRLSWSYGGEPYIGSFNIYRKDDCGSYSPAASGIEDEQESANGVQYDDGVGIDLSGHCYTYYVTAVSVFGGESTGCEASAEQIGTGCGECTGDDDDDGGGVAAFYVPDRDDGKIYKYDTNGNFLGTFDLDRDNDNPRGTAATDTNVYVVNWENNYEDVYRYSVDGGDADVSGEIDGRWYNALTNPNGIAVDGDQMWVVCEYDRRIYRYSIDDAFGTRGDVFALQEIDMQGSNDAAQGLALDASYVYVLDDQDDRLYRYPRAGGGEAASRTLKLADGSSLREPAGVTIRNGSAWVLEGDESGAYIAKYDLGDLFSGSGSLTPSFQFELDSGNDEPEGL